MADIFDFRIRTRDDLVRAVERFGFVPFFKNRIQGFSLAEHAAPEVWFSDEARDLHQDGLIPCPPLPLREIRWRI